MIVSYLTSEAPVSFHEPSNRPSHPTNVANLEWLLVINTRRSWTAVSVMVLALAGLVLFGRHVGRASSLLGCAATGLAVASGVVWLHAQQNIVRLHRSLARPIQWTHLLGN